MNEIFTIVKSEREAKMRCLAKLETESDGMKRDGRSRNTQRDKKAYCEAER